MASSPSGSSLPNWKSPISAASVARTPTSAAAAMHHPIRSCVACSTRRVRCDRQQPACGNCARARAHGLGSDCVYPTGRGRAPKRRRDPRGSAADEQQVAERLARLEAMIRQAGEHDQSPDGNDSATAADEPSSTPGSRRVSAGHIVNTPETPHERGFGRLKVTKTDSHYVNDAMWGGLMEEVEELRSFLLGSSSDDEVDTEEPSDGNTGTPPATGPTTILFGLGTTASSLLGSRPSLAQAAALFAAFCGNVAPVMRLMHMPTLTRRYWNAASSPDKVDRDTEALVLAINYVSAATLSDEKCTTELGQTRHQVLLLYRAAAEQALARAHLLSTRSPTLLQAAVFYIEALQKSDDAKAGQPAAVRSLVVLVHHLARAMGLHRDGDAYGLPPFEAEMRRRLWWYICILDHRTAEACGAEPAVRPRSFDARLPLHVDDADLSPEMPALPSEGHGAITDMTFCLVRYETLETVWCVYNDTVSLAEKQTAIRDLERRLEDRYFRYCNPDIPFQVRMLLAGRMVAKRLWFMAHWPSRERDTGHHQPPQSVTTPPSTANGSAATRDQLFAAAADLLGAAADILANPALSPWLWHAQTYSHWHALAFVLHELRRRPPGPDPESERAWRYARAVYEGWLAGSADANNLRRPMKRLFEKVRRERGGDGAEGRGSDAAAGAGALSSADGSCNDGEEMDSEDSLDRLLNAFSSELGDGDGSCHPLMADQDMADYFHFGESDSWGLPVADFSS
ncbi:bikaverin cluster-transcription factor [Apiospora kogelbergensis]|uniref:Bikaverin cluster-transcription factor n=1 Tax=Apiospora kogelbergensis TaxID=1337665 RepID=A0AAW0R1Y7_9PEZI